MLKIEFTAQFKKDYKLAKRRGFKLEKLTNVLNLLANQEILPPEYRDHALVDSKDYQGVRECHIENDWLLVYKVYDEVLVLKLIRTGTHSDLFV